VPTGLTSLCLLSALSLPSPAVATKPPPGPGSPPAHLKLGKGDRVVARHAEGVSGVAFSPDGKLLATAGCDKMIRLWDLDNDKEVGRFEGHSGHIRTVAFSPDGKLLASAADDNAIFVWDVAARKQVRRVGHHTAKLFTAFFSPNGKTLVSSGFDEHIGLWDATSGKQLQFFRAHPRVPYGVALAPDGRTLASGGDEEGTIRLWDVATGKEIRCWNGHGQHVYSVAISPDGRLLASGGNDTSARLWELASGKEVRRFDGHDGGVFRVAFAPDGRTLLSCSYNSSAHLWEIMTGKEIRRFGKHTGWVWGVAYSPKGRSVATASKDGTAVVWSLGALPSLAAAQPNPLTDAELDDAWRDLAGPDAAKAFDAALVLSAAPAEQVVPYLRPRIRPAARVEGDAGKIQSLIRDLDHKDFKVRDGATKDLEELSHRAGPALHKALAKPRSLEMRRRLELLVSKLNAREIPPKRLRELRALRVLEELPVPDSRRLLQELAAGAPDDLLTREAVTVLARLAKRSGAAP
jgi:dipeptidyl aminopeptidase/acylaminoacyl peptidase